MVYFSNAQETSDLFGGYIEQVQQAFAAHHVPFGSPADFPAFAETLETNSQLRSDLAVLARSFVTGDENVSLRTLLSILSVASGGPDLAASDGDMSQPVSVLVDFLISLGLSKPTGAENTAGAEKTDSPSHPTDVMPYRVELSEEGMYQPYLPPPPSLDRHPVPHQTPLAPTPPSQTPPTLIVHNQTLPDLALPDQTLPKETLPASFDDNVNPSPLETAPTLPSLDPLPHPAPENSLVESLARLELNSLQVKHYLDSIEQRISRIEPRLDNLPTHVLPATPPQPGHAMEARYSSALASESLPEPLHEPLPHPLPDLFRAPFHEPLPEPFEEPFPEPLPDLLHEPFHESFSDTPPTPPAPAPTETATTPEPASPIEPAPRPFPARSRTNLIKPIRNLGNSILSRTSRKHLLIPAATAVAAIFVLSFLYLGLRQNISYIIRPASTPTPEAKTTPNPAPAASVSTPNPIANATAPEPQPPAVTEAAIPEAAAAPSSAPPSHSTSVRSTPVRRPTAAANPATASTRVPLPKPSAASLATPPNPASPAAPDDWNSPPTPIAEPVNVSSGIMAANVLSAPHPSYPKLASLTHMQGAVVMQAVISREGTIEHVHVIKGHHLLRGAATSAVRNWRYRPYLVNGHPVEVATIVSVDFKLPE